MRARVQKLEASPHRLEDIVQTQAQDVVGLATGFARTDNRVFVQNTASAAIHMAKGAGDGHTLCGWKFTSVRSRMPGPPYRFIASLTDMPGCMMCEECLPTERAISMARYEAELSGDDLYLYSQIAAVQKYD